MIPNPKASQHLQDPGQLLKIESECSELEITCKATYMSLEELIHYLFSATASIDVPIWNNS